MNHYPQGNLVQFQNIFRNLAGFAVDPDVVEFAVKVGQNPSSTPITYTSATVPSVGVIARIGVGRYLTWFDSTTCSGQVIGKWTSTGAGQAEVEDCVYIDPAAF